MWPFSKPKCISSFHHSILPLPVSVLPFSNFGFLCYHEDDGGRFLWNIGNVL
jgi:hypothetical protein